MKHVLVKRLADVKRVTHLGTVLAISRDGHNIEPSSLEVSQSWLDLSSEVVPVVGQQCIKRELLQQLADSRRAGVRRDRESLV